MAWQAASDIEYCLFLLSLLHSNEALSFSLKLKSSSKIEIDSALTSALETLKEAKGSLEDDDLLKAREKTWQARSYLFRVQEVFEKKRKIGAEQASTPRA